MRLHVSYVDATVSCQPYQLLIHRPAVIKSFKNAATQAVINGESPKGFPSDLLKAARRKLRYLNAAANLEDLRAPLRQPARGFET